MTDVIVKIIVELLSVLALATKQIQLGRFSKCTITYILSMVQYIIEKFAKKLLGKSEVEAVLQNLDRMARRRQIVFDSLRVGVSLETGFACAYLASYSPSTRF
jgi:hypothetical protein